MSAPRQPDDRSTELESLRASVAQLRRQVAEREEAAEIAKGQGRLLRRLARGARLPEVLRDLALMVERQAPGMLCSILLLDPAKNRLRHGAAPSLPPAYTSAIDGIQIGPAAGSCGTAAYRGQPVIVEDIAIDPLCEESRDVALPHGLRACWSYPICSTGDRVLGTLAMYYRQPRGPTCEEERLIETAADLASVAIERERSQTELSQAREELDERVRAGSAALTESEARFRTIFQRLGAGMAVVGPDGRFVEVNSAFRRLLGFSEAELRQTSVFDITHPEDREDSRRAFEDARERRAPLLDLDKRYLRKDGTTVWGHCTGSWFFDDRGTPLYGVAIVQDIADRKHAERALRDSEERLLAVLDNTPAVIYTKDRDGRFLLINRRFEQLFGVKRGEVYGKTDFDLFPHDMAKAFRANDRRVLDSDEALETEEVAPHSDGPHTYLSLKFPLRRAANETYAVCGISTDITARKRAEHALTESNRYNRMLFEQSPIGLALCRMNGELVDVNAAYAQILGRSIAETLGATYWEVTPPEYTEQEREQLQRLETTGRYGPYEKEYVRGDGSRVPVRLSGMVIHQAGEPFIWSSIEDISDRKRAEALERKQRELVQTELERVKADLVRQTRLAAIGQVAASIAHELRNPLGAARNAAYLLRRRSRRKSSNAEYLRIIDEEIETSGRIISNLLEMARATAPHKEMIDLGELLREVFKRVGARTGVEFRLDLNPDPFRIQADRDQFRQVLDNLFSNAIQATQGNGEIIVAATRDARYNIIIVRDTGPGIAAADRDRLFEPLFTRKAKGTGLGLTICRQIVERHGGTIDAVDTGGAGAALRVRLPVEGPAAARASDR